MSTFTNPLLAFSQPKNTTQKTCRAYKPFLPSFTPRIDHLSSHSSIHGQYAEVFIQGFHFLNNGTTYVQFGSVSNIPVIFYSSFTISFVVPLNAVPGEYKIVVVNIYNGNFSLPVKNTYPAILDTSNEYVYTIL